MILPAQAIRNISPPIVFPFYEKTIEEGMSYGLSHAGYDVRIAETILVHPGEFYLASTIENFWMPDDVLGSVADKSTWARRGLACQNTVIEPGWRGFLTLELTNHHPKNILLLKAGMPIAQIIFMRLEESTERPYSGKYQDQAAGPQSARDERG